MFVASLLPPVTATEISDLQFQFRSRRIIGETYDLFQTEHYHKLRYELVLHQASVSHYKLYCQVNCRFLQLYCLFLSLNFEVINTVPYSIEILSFECFCLWLKGVT